MSHADTTVVMSIIVSTFAIAISVFNIIMCSPNEFDPIMLQIELKRRQDNVNKKELKIKAQKEELKKKMLANVTAQSKAAEIANIGYLFGSYKAGPVKSKDMPLGKMGNDIQM